MLELQPAGFARVYSPEIGFVPLNVRLWKSACFAWSVVESDFLSAILHDVQFESCTLEKTIFDQVKCKQVDLRSSELLELSGWSSLRGAIIDSVQLAAIAPYLAQELGISIRS